MKISRIALAIIIMLIITGCSTTTNNDNNSVSETSSEGSYEAILFVNGVELQSVGETAKELGLVPGEIIGKVTEKVDIEIVPTSELTSNYLNEGTKIYTVQGNTDMVLAKKDGEFEVFD